MRIHQIVRRRYFSIKVTLLSPISISNGEIENTDSDIMANGKGECFIPGSSMAGAFRNYLGIPKDKDCIYGFSKDRTGRMSSIFISDFYFVNNKPNKNNTKAKKSVRDRVALIEKTVENKFDMEILEPGISGEIRLEIVEREGDMYDYDRAVMQIIEGLQSGEIRLGANKNRGFGRFEVTGVFEKSFDRNSRKEWIVFCETGFDKLGDDVFKPYESWIKGKNSEACKYVKCRRSLLLKGGISIRRYSAKPGKADYEHITSDGKPVIPGTSWNGAIRSDVVRILKLLGYGTPEKLIERWFGYVRTDGTVEDKARQSMVIISESVIDKARPVPITRNRINRFTAGTKEGALYSEISYFDGSTTLEFFVKKDDASSYKALLGVLWLVSEDISKGYVAVGGQTGIGRGLFSEDPKNPKMIFDKDVDVNECLTELYNLVKENKE